MLLLVLLTGQLKPARTVLTYLHRTVPPSMGLSVWCGLVCTGLEWARSLAQTSARIGRRLFLHLWLSSHAPAYNEFSECVLMAPQLRDGRVWWNIYLVYPYLVQRLKTALIKGGPRGFGIFGVQKREQSFCIKVCSSIESIFIFYWNYEAKISLKSNMGSPRSCSLNGLKPPLHFLIFCTRRISLLYLLVCLFVWMKTFPRTIGEHPAGI